MVSIVLHRVLTDDLGPMQKTIPRTSLERMRLNNAVLLARRAYARDLQIFDEVYHASGNDISKTIQQIIALTRNSKDPFDAIRAWLRARSA